MNDETLSLIRIIAISSFIGLFVGLILRTFFKRQSKSFVESAESLGWGWFLAFGIFMMGLAFYSWRDGNLWAVAIFLLLAA